MYLPSSQTKMSLLTYLLTYLLTPWRRVLLEKLIDLQLVKKFPAFHGTRKFITAITSVRHLSLSWASPIQSIYPHPTSWRSILILSTHLRLGLPSGLLPSGFLTKTIYTPSPHSYAPNKQKWANAQKCVRLLQNSQFKIWYALCNNACKHIFKTSKKWYYNPLWTTFFFGATVPFFLNLTVWMEVDG